MTSRTAQALTSPANDAPTLTRRLADYWAEARYEDMPADVVARCKEVILDTLAAAVAGQGSDEVNWVVAAVDAATGRRDEGVTVWGARAPMLPASAALVNGTAAHARELDDCGGCAHSGAVVIPPVMALAETGKADGRSVLLATIAGYDIARRIMHGVGGYAKHNHHGWHSTGTVGAFGAAAGAARMMGLGAEAFTNALGIAGSFTGGLWAFIDDGAMTKRLHPGKAAETGLMAAYLAQAGATGPTRIFEAEWGGFFTTYGVGEDRDPEAMTQRLGKSFLLMETATKPYACCRESHGPLDVLLAVMREEGATADDIVGITAHCGTLTLRMVNATPINNVLDAQMSLPYCLAVAADSGRCTLDQFEPLRLTDPAIRSLLGRISMVADPTIQLGELPRLDIHFRDGKVRHGQINLGQAKGAPANRMSKDEVWEKALSLLEPRLGAATAKSIADMVDHLDDLPDASELARALRASK